MSRIVAWIERQTERLEAYRIKMDARRELQSQLYRDFTAKAVAEFDALTVAVPSARATLKKIDRLVKISMAKFDAVSKVQDSK